MHVFITGIAGFLGSNLANFYLDKNYKVSGCDNLVGGDKRSFEEIHSRGRGNKFRRKSATAFPSIPEST